MRAVNCQPWLPRGWLVETRSFVTFLDETERQWKLLCHRWCNVPRMMCCTINCVQIHTQCKKMRYVNLLSAARFLSMNKMVTHDMHVTRKVSSHWIALSSHVCALCSTPATNLDCSEPVLLRIRIAKWILKWMQCFLWEMLHINFQPLKYEIQ